MDAGQLEWDLGCMDSKQADSEDIAVAAVSFDFTSAEIAAWKLVETKSRIKRSAACDATSITVSLIPRRPHLLANTNLYFSHGTITLEVWSQCPHPAHAVLYFTSHLSSVTCHFALAMKQPRLPEMSNSLQ